jgi:hypothetical protein
MTRLKGPFNPFSFHRICQGLNLSFFSVSPFATAQGPLQRQVVLAARNSVGASSRCFCTHAPRPMPALASPSFDRPTMTNENTSSRRDDGAAVVVADDDCELIRSVQSAVKRIRRLDPTLRRLWLQKGIRCTRVEGRDLLAALQHATKSSSPSAGSSSASSSPAPTHSTASSSCALRSVRICGGLYAGLREVAKWPSTIRLLAQLDKLQELVVEPHLVIRDASTYLEMLQLLEPRLPSLRRLELNSRHMLSQHDAPSVVEALRSAQCLRDLVARDLVLTGNNVDLSAMIAGIVRNLPNLETMDLVVTTAATPERRPALTIECVRAICRSSLRSITLRGLDLPGDSSGVWAQELRLNTTLRRVHLGGWSSRNPDTDVRETHFLVPIIETMMDHQWSLEGFQVDDDAGAADGGAGSAAESTGGSVSVLRRQQLNAMCALNRSCRRAVVHNPNSKREDWVELLATSGGDANAMYWLLLKNPNLCCRPGPRFRPTTTTRVDGNRTGAHRLCRVEAATLALTAPGVFEVDL